MDQRIVFHGQARAATLTVVPTPLLHYLGQLSSGLLEKLRLFRLVFAAALIEYRLLDLAAKGVYGGLGDGQRQPLLDPRLEQHSKKLGVA